MTAKISIIKNDKVIDEIPVSSSISGVTLEQLTIALDTMLRNNGILDEHTEIAVTDSF